MSKSNTSLDKSRAQLSKLAKQSTADMKEANKKLDSILEIFAPDKEIYPLLKTAVEVSKIH